MHPSGKTEPPLPFPDGTIRLIEPHCLNNVAKHRNSEPKKPPAGSGPWGSGLTRAKAKYGTFRYLGEKHSGTQKLAGDGSLCGHIRLIEPHRLSYVAKHRKVCTACKAPAGPAAGFVPGVFSVLPNQKPLMIYQFLSPRNPGWTTSASTKCYLENELNLTHTR